MMEYKKVVQLATKDFTSINAFLKNSTFSFNQCNLKCIFGYMLHPLMNCLSIRPSEMGVLNIITQTPAPHTPVLLADLLGVSKPMITAHLNDLAKKGYIEKRQSPDDKRIFYILPTEKALILVHRAKMDLDQSLERLAKEMGEEEFDDLVRLAEKANEILDTIKKECK